MVSFLVLSEIYFFVAKLIVVKVVKVIEVNSVNFCSVKVILYVDGWRASFKNIL